MKGKERRITLINPSYKDNIVRTLKAQYYKNSVANFLRGGHFGASAVGFIYERDETKDKDKKSF